ncbi:hypothetical protein BJF78_02155 [Pseudonocardia sp. CNS-139]|nr:hypothetical protein BJF78_02155 [Pseudonocardia sp. CNS-139]
MATDRDRRATRLTTTPVSAEEIDIYARISRAPSGETIKVDDQIKMGTEDIEDRGLRVGTIFRDDSLSAWNPKVIRDEWIKMMGRLESGASTGVWILEVSRFTRKPIEGERLIAAANDGKRVLTPEVEFDLTTAAGRSAFRDAINKAAAESDFTSERVKRGNARRIKRGRSLGGIRGYGTPGLAPKPDDWEAGDPRYPESPERVEAERLIVRECYDRCFEEKASWISLARELNERGMAGERAALPVTGGLWTQFTLARTMTRPALAGLLYFKGEKVGELAKVKGVVSEEEWQRMCALLQARRSGRPHVPTYPLSGVIMCQCGRARISGVTRRSVPPYPDGEPRREYRCRLRQDLPVEQRGCGHNSMDARLLEQAVDAAMTALLGDPRNAERVAQRLGENRSERARIKAELDFNNDEADALA